MSKRLKLLSVVTVLGILLSSCGCSHGSLVVEKEAKRREATGESWTVLLYMCAGDMEEKDGRASEVLSSLSFDLPENINVVVETGGSHSWSNSEIRADRIHDYTVQKNGLRVINENLIKNMGDGATYQEFLDRNIEKFPADNYISIIWGNGGGVTSGAAYDATHNYDPLTVTEISTAHANVGVQFDIIGFDASLMSTIETATAMSVFCDYLVATEGMMPISGWDYRALFEFISNNPQATAVNVAQSICDKVIENAKNNNEPTAQMSVTDLSKVTRLLQSFDSMAYTMADATGDVSLYRALQDELSEVHSLGANSEIEGYSNIVDMVSMAKAVFDATASDTARISNTLSKTVVYNVCASELNESCGLGVYYPLDRTVDSINRYRTICPSIGYMEYIDVTETKWLVTDKSREIKDTAAYMHYTERVGYNSIEAFYDPTGIYSLTVVSPEILAGAGVNIYKYDEESGRYMYLLTDYDTENVGNTYTYEFKNKVFELNGTAVSADLISAGEDWALYSVPVMYQKEYASIRVLKLGEDDDYEYKVLGLWRGIDAEAGISRKFKSLGSGDTITPIYKVFGGDAEEYVEGKSLRPVFGGVTIKEKTVADGDYMISFTTRDIYGVRVESNTTTVSALKGKFKTAN